MIIGESMKRGGLGLVMSQMNQLMTMNSMTCTMSKVYARL